MKDKTKVTAKDLILRSHSREIEENRLYHITNNLESILEDNELKGSKLWGTISLTADSKIVKPHLYCGIKKHRIVLDFNKLKRDYPSLVPRFYSFSSSMPKDVEGFYKEHGYKNPNKTPEFQALMCSQDFSWESEWVLDRPIKNLNKYLIKVEEVK